MQQQVRRGATRKGRPDLAGEESPPAAPARSADPAASTDRVLAAIDEALAAG